MNKTLVGVAAVAVAAAAAYPAWVLYQGHLVDQEISKISGEELHGFGGARYWTEIQETGRSWSSRQLEVRIKTDDPMLSELKDQIVYSGQVDLQLGLNVRGTFKSDPRAGILALYTLDGKVPYNDHGTFSVSTGGKFENLTWTVDPINYTGEQEKSHFRMERLDFTMTADGKDYTFNGTIPAIAYENPEGGLDIKGLGARSKSSDKSGTVEYFWETMTVNTPQQVIPVGKLNLSVQAELLTQNKEKPDLVNGVIKLSLGGVQSKEVSFDNLTMELTTDKLPVLDQQRADESPQAALEALRTYAAAFEQGMTIRIPSLKVTNGQNESVFSLELMKKETTNGLAIGEADLSFDPASLGNGPVAKSLAKEIRNTGRQYWREENGLIKAHWTFPYEYLGVLTGAG